MHEFGRWTTARLSTHLEKETGIKLSGEQVRRILKEKKYAYHWGKYSREDKQNKKKREALLLKNCQAILKPVKKSQTEYRYFWDESG